MRADTSVDKSWEDLWSWGQTDLRGLVDYIFALQAEVRRLKDSAAQNSSNSSRPPSTDREKPAPKSLREKSGRKPGGQPGHPGSTLAFCDHPEEVKVHPLEECSRCGEDLSKLPAEDYEARQVYDLPELKLKCTEHRGQIKDCPCCHCQCTARFPEDVTAPVQYGKNFRSLLVYLYDVQEGATRRVSEMCQEMFGYPVSEATLQAARQKEYEALEPFENRLVEILPQEPVLSADETQVPVNKVKHWVHIISTPLLTFFSIQVLRGKEAIKAIGIIPKFTGWLMHDFLSSYLGFENCLHTFCKGHLMRELVFLFEQHHQSWAKDLHDLFLEMLLRVKQLRARDSPLTEAECKRWHQRYWRIVRAGRKANPLTPEQQAKKRRKQSKEQNLLDRLEGYDLSILAFLWVPDLPFTNNEAERPFRMIKVRVKISGCFRTLEGARRHMRIRSYISTLRKHGLPVLEYLRRAIDGDPFLPERTKTT
jgi:transposase